MTLIATQLGAGMIFGTALESYSYGFYGLAYTLGIAGGLLVLGLGVAAKLRSLNISTTAELFETKYGSRRLRQVASLISIFTMGGILAGQIVASRQLFLSLFDLNPWWLIMFWLLIIGYTMFGGLKAVIATDILQVIMIIVVFVAVLFLVIPPSEMSKLLSSPEVLGNKPPLANGFFATLVAPILFAFIQQDLAQRFFASKNQRTATISALLASCFILLFAMVPVMLGTYAKFSGIIFMEGQSPLVILLEKKFGTLGMTIVACALLAAICSTADSLLQAASCNLVADFLSVNEKYSLTASRIITFSVGLIALIVAFKLDNVIGILIKSYEISISALFIPLIFALFSNKPSRIGARIAVCLGILTFVLGSNLDMALPPMMLALQVSFIGYISGSLWQRTLIR